MPECVVIFSGKRKSGKDFATDLLQNRLSTEKCSILRLSEPLKRQYAKENNLDLSRLLDASDYKEYYRSDMIRWGEEKRNLDPAYFCQLICQGPGSEKPIWIISDARRRTDVDYFVDNYKDCVVLIRVEAREEVRRQRGWVYQPGVDNAESECGLDTGIKWNYIIENNGSISDIEEDLNKIIKLINS